MNKRLITIVCVSATCVLIATGVWKMYTIGNTEASIEIQKKEEITNTAITKEKINPVLDDFSYRMNKACEDDLSQDGVVEISYQSKIITTLTNQNCPIDDVHFFAVIDDTVLFSILPSGLGGYMIYPSYHNIHILDVTTQKITQILKGVIGIPAIDSKRKNIAFVKYDGDPALSDNDPKFRLTILNLTNDKQNSFGFTLEHTAQIGHLIFSPDGNKVAIEVGYGPEGERGEIYIFDIPSQKMARQVTENKHLKIDRWKNENEVVWSEWKIGE